MTPAELEACLSEIRALDEAKRKEAECSQPGYEYKDCRIENIRRGKISQGRGHLIYATLVSKDGDVLINATLDYIANALADRLPPRN